ncbi:MAG: ATP-binding protein [Candidatus Thermoplasmatota archaeon]|nr:ATP-binding protein [Candidatus Thermoplasmatota archaeon]
MSTGEVNFHPTKQLFIDVLTRDISIRDCILDLLDNSVDAYTNHGIEEPRDIKLSFNDEYFQIYDTCGGISKDELENEAFRLGLTEESPKTSTIGVYGIGLKRAIFKLGKTIVVETDDGINYCKLTIPVDKWLKDKDSWVLDLDVVKESSLEGRLPYTIINITDLHYTARDVFRTIDFQRDISEDISHYYSLFITEKQLVFYVNDNHISGHEITIRTNDTNKPVKHQYSFEGVDITIICWLHIGDKDVKTLPSGWNVYMNKRLVIFDDTSRDTGWIGEKPYFPKYHSIYNQFRGIVFLETNQPLLLPMNTSKNGFNKESMIYSNLLLKMCETGRPFIDYLANKYNKSKEMSEDIEESLEEKMKVDASTENSYKETSLSEAKYEVTFNAPPRTRRTNKKEVSIQYKKPKTRVDIVKEYLDLSSNSDVGSETFEYFWNSEGLDE